MGLGENGKLVVIFGLAFAGIVFCKLDMHLLRICVFRVADEIRTFAAELGCGCRFRNKT